MGRVFKEGSTGSGLYRNYQTDRPKSRSGNFHDFFDLANIRLKLLSGFYAFWGNKRLQWGLIFILVLAPLAKFSYLLLPKEGFGEYFFVLGKYGIKNTLEGPYNGWYWGTIRMYLFSNGELLTPTLVIFGLFLLFPKKYFPSYLAGIPFGYYLSLLVHRMFFVTSNEDFDEAFE